jgi:hypothetical protein
MTGGGWSASLASNNDERITKKKKNRNENHTSQRERERERGEKHTPRQLDHFGDLPLLLLHS